MTERAFLKGLKPTLHISHRGGALLYPENTLFAFGKAVTEHRTQMLELDVHLSKDGAAMVAHDPTLDRCTDATGPIAERTLEELRRIDAGYKFTPDGGKTFPFRGQGIGIPTLDEVFKAFPDMRFNIELKTGAPGAAVVMAKSIRFAKAEDQVCVGGESDEVGARLVQALPECCHFYPRQALTAFVMCVHGGDNPPVEERFQVLDMPVYFQGMRLITKDLLEAAAADGKWINVWTVDDEAEMRKLVEEGIGGIMTDRPDLLRKVLGGSGT